MKIAEKEKVPNGIRILRIYNKLIKGSRVSLKKEAEECGVHIRTIKRDIFEAFEYLKISSDNDSSYEIKSEIITDMDGKHTEYYLNKNIGSSFDNSEVLAVIKILLESRAFTKEIIDTIIYKIIENCVPKENKKIVSNLIANEQFHYVELRHKTNFLNTLWDIGMAVYEKKAIEIEYIRLKENATVHRTIHPLGIMFSEYYFYIAAFIAGSKEPYHIEGSNENTPTIYRIDRIKAYKVLDEHFKVLYKDRFEEGEFRKRIQFMFGGKLRTVRFKYAGPSVEAVLDRLPTAKVISEANGVWIVSVEVFGSGIDMWLRSQGDYVEIL